MPAKYIEGYWFNPNSPAVTKQYPIPQAREQPAHDQEAFLTALKKLESKARQDFYKGFSTCRICGKMNGSSEFTASEWSWPQGYRHYIEAHNVRPSHEFHSFVFHRPVGNVLKVNDPWPPDWEGTEKHDAYVGRIYMRIPGSTVINWVYVRE